MARRLVQLKLRLLRNALHSSTAAQVSFLVSSALAILVAIGTFVVLALLRGQSVSVDVASVTFTVFALGWLILPIFAFGLDSTLDPASLTLYPLRIRPLAVGLLAASAAGAWPLANVIGLLGVTIGLARGPSGVLVAVLAVLLQVLFCITLARLVTTGMAGLLRSRRGKGLAVFLIIPIFALYEFFSQVVPKEASDGKFSAASFAGLDSWLRWLPPGLSAHAIQDASVRPAVQRPVPEPLHQLVQLRGHRADVAGAQEGRRELSRLITKGVSEREDRGLAPRDDLIDIIDFVQADGSVVMNDDVLPETILSGVKANQLRFLSYQYRMPGPLRTSVTAGLESLVAAADDAYVDLLLAVSSGSKVGVMHRAPGRGQWRTGLISAQMSRASLLSLGAYAGRRSFGAADQSHDTWSRVASSLGAEPAALPYILATNIAAWVSTLDLGDRLALILSPELSPFPVTAAVAGRLAQTNRPVAVGELDMVGLWDGDIAADGAPVELRDYVGFVLKGQPESEVQWGSLGLPGRRFTTFTGAEILAAMENGPSVVHIVSHGLLDYRDPLFSLLATSDDLCLMEIDLLGRRLTSDLVILNGCSTAAAGAFGGWHGFSFARGVLSAGVKAVVGNTLPIESRDAVRFASVFQQQMIQ